MTRSLRTPALAALALCVLSGPALAHAHLQNASPSINGTAASAPTELRLGFSEGVNLKFSGVQVTGPDQRPVVLGAPQAGSGGSASLVIPVNGSLPPGIYTVHWHALAVDGHKTDGSYTFTVKP